MTMKSTHKTAGREFFSEEDGKSRSQKKRESTALQSYGEALACLSPMIWDRLPISNDLRRALDQWRGMKSWGAKRRHMQFIGRLMRELDEPDDLFSALDDYI
jgi:ribosome-associated protein